MKKAGEFFVASIERPKKGVYPKFANLDLRSFGAIDEDCFVGFFNDEPLKVAVFVIPEGENSDDYELVKKIK